MYIIDSYVGVVYFKTFVTYIVLLLDPFVNLFQRICKIVYDVGPFCFFMLKLAPSEDFGIF